MPTRGPVEELLPEEGVLLLRDASRRLHCTVPPVDQPGPRGARRPPPPDGPLPAAAPEADPQGPGATAATYLLAALFHDGDRLAHIVRRARAGHRPSPPCHARYLIRVARGLSAAARCAAC